MALFRFFFAPVLLAVAVIAGRADRARAPVPATEIRAAPAAERGAQAAPPVPAQGRAARHRAPAR